MSSMRSFTAVIPRTIPNGMAVVIGSNAFIWGMNCVDTTTYAKPFNRETAQHCLASLSGLIFHRNQRLRPIGSTLDSIQCWHWPITAARQCWCHRRLISNFAVFLYFWNSEKVKWFFAHQNLISNWLTNLVHAKSTSELIRFGFSDCSVWSLVRAKLNEKNHFLACLWSQSEFRSQR